MSPVVYLKRSEATWGLLEHPDAWFLFSYIALHADKAGECLIGRGVFTRKGMSEKRYRLSKAFLTGASLISVSQARGGTVAKIICSEVYTLSPPKQGEGINGHSGEAGARVGRGKGAEISEGVLRDPGRTKKWEPDETQLRLNALYGRRKTTRWDTKMLKVYREIDWEEEDIQLVERWHNATPPPGEEYYRRNTLPTLLNNWDGEVDKARKWASNGGEEKKRMRMQL